ncbi:MAG: hypothetical protein ABIK62_06065 [candidate division WOR-3 bacterium]
MSYLLRAGCLVLCAVSCGVNRPPRVTSLSAFPEHPQPGESVQVMVRAIDPEHGRLHYRWRATGGRLGPARDSTIVWYAPRQSGRFRVWVRVFDALGARDSKSIEFEIRLPDRAADTAFAPPDRRAQVVPEPRRPGGRQSPRRSK